MTRSTALRIFGLDETASKAAVWAAYSALRSHLESRLRAADAMERAGALAFFREQLGELEAALELTTGADPKTAATTGVNRMRPADASHAVRSKTSLRQWASRVVVLIAVSIVLDWGWEWTLARPGGIGSSREKGSSAPGSRQASAQLRLRGNLEGAVAQIIDQTTGEVIWRGPADGRPLEVPQGNYTLVVDHPQCPDSWREGIRLAAGQQAERLAQNCKRHGLLAVRANVDGARVTIDDREAVASDRGETTLSAGPHRIRVEREGHEAWEASIDLAAGSRTALQADLAPRPAPATPAPPTPTVASAAPGRQAAELKPERKSVERTHEWHRTAREYLLARYDRDQSGHLDSRAEVEAIPCSDWQGLEQSFDAGGLALSMTRFYGFDGSKWVEDAFGVTNEMRGGAYLRLKDCGLR